MKKQGYQVTSRHPICIDFPDGRAVNYPRGARFVAHPMNACVRRALRRNDLRIVGPGETPVKEVKLGLPPSVQSRIEFNAKRDAARAAAAVAKQAKGRELIARSSIKPAKPADSAEN